MLQQELAEQKKADKAGRARVPFRELEVKLDTMVPL